MQNNIRQTEARHSREAILRELISAGAVEKGRAIKCPFHDDKNPSGSLKQGDDGVWRFHCFTPACGFHGDIFDVIARASGRDVADVLKAENQRDEAPKREKRVFNTPGDIYKSVSSLGTVEAVYEYVDPATKKTQVVQVRYIGDDGKKKFLTHRAESGGFVLGAPPKPWPIYNRTRVRDSEYAFLVEGEKVVHALASIGIIATTSLSGAMNGDKADYSPLAGKRVILWPDNDDSGISYITTVAKMLEGVNPFPEVSIAKISDIPELGKGDDLADLIARGWTAEDIWTFVNDGAEPVGPAADLDLRISKIQSGEYKNLPWPWHSLTREARALLPGTVTVLCGDPSSSKSFMLLQAIEWWNANGCPAAIKMLEGTRADHLHRLIAILSGNWNLLDPEWCKNNSDALPFARNQWKSVIDQLARRISCDELGKVTYASILLWIKTQIDSGAMIVCVDPVTAVQTKDGRAGEDHEFIVQLSSLARNSGARIVLVTHPRTLNPKQNSGTMDDMAGARAFSRHTDCVLWLARHDPSEGFQCMTSAGPSPYNCNRSIKIAKARNAVGHGKRIAFHLGADAQFTERGIIVGKAVSVPEEL